ncbi:hypothetical protein BpHYR1_032307 [Brachionus plicatilis]|uniref:Uncharacterized protein n=1 Tax=Brachionus plicatilis TaxID=10195 RepID=A0A3M7Q5F2_BRAPC|nr:hypothetical protein BpHYR1_032307 [Brachionus plicatilis]
MYNLSKTYKTKTFEFCLPNEMAESTLVPAKFTVSLDDLCKICREMKAFEYFSIKINLSDYRKLPLRRVNKEKSTGHNHLENKHLKRGKINNLIYKYL